MAERYVFLMDIAESLGESPNSFVTRIRRTGIKTAKIRNREGGHLAHAVTEDVARAIIAAEKDAPEIIKPEDLFKQKGD